MAGVEAGSSVLLDATNRSNVREDRVLLFGPRIASGWLWPGSKRRTEGFETSCETFSIVV